MLHDTALQLAIEAGRTAPKPSDYALAKQLLASWNASRKALGLPLWQ